LTMRWETLCQFSDHSGHDCLTGQPCVRMVFSRRTTQGHSEEPSRAIDAITSVRNLKSPLEVECWNDYVHIKYMHYGPPNGKISTTTKKGWDPATTNFGSKQHCHTVDLLGSRTYHSPVVNGEFVPAWSSLSLRYFL